MQKALTTEDLLYILNSVFKIASEENNAISFKEGKGLYVEDYHHDLEQHATDEKVHVTERIRKILDDITIDVDTDDLYYRGILLSRVSQKANNAIKQEPDGIFVNDFEEETKDHIADETRHVTPAYTEAIDEHLTNPDIHVTLSDQTNWNNHKDDKVIHVTGDDTKKWNGHVDNQEVHVTKKDKETWNKTLEEAREHALSIFRTLSLYDFCMVHALPTDPEKISTRTAYILWPEDEEPTTANGVYIWNEVRWFQLAIPGDVMNAFMQLVAQRLETLEKASHTHDNKTTLDNFTEDKDGNLLYNGTDIRQLSVSGKEKNAISLVDGQLYAPDYIELIRSLQISAAFVRENLYNEECPNSGTYELKGHIDDYSMLIIDYYFKNAEGEVGNAKSAMVDVDTMNDLYAQGIDYILELGYGISTANSKIRFHDDKLIINYYHNVCVYKVTGIRKGDING